MNNFICEKCGKLLPENEYYNIYEKPDAPPYPLPSKLKLKRHETCKECLCDGFSWHDIRQLFKILKQLDIAFMPDIWNEQVWQTFHRGYNPCDPVVSKIILSRYIAKMSLWGLRSLGFKFSKEHIECIINNT